MLGAGFQELDAGCLVPGRPLAFTQALVKVEDAGARESSRPEGWGGRPAGLGGADSWPKSLLYKVATLLLWAPVPAGRSGPAPGFLPAIVSRYRSSQEAIGLLAAEAVGWVALIQPLPRLFIGCARPASKRGQLV